jgi:hypothetical protein
MILVSVFAICTCLSTCPAQDRITPEEYSIYSVVLQHISREKRRKGVSKLGFVILSETKREILPWDREPRGGRGLRANYRKRNKTSLTLEPEFPANYNISLMSNQELDQLLEKGKLEAAVAEKEFRKTHDQRYGYRPGCDTLWRYFYAKLPEGLDTYGPYRFTRIGFSTNHRFAFVEIDGTGCSWGYHGSFILIRTKKGWIVHTAGEGFGFA